MPNNCIVDKVTLFFLQNESIKISIQVYFNELDQLYFDGYDIGKAVNEVWGDSDYEYTYTIQPVEVEKIYYLFGIKVDDKSSLLQEIKNRFSCNKAYTLFGEFMKENSINFESFTWT